MKIEFGVLLLAFSTQAHSVNRMIDDSYLSSGGSGSTAFFLGVIHALPMLGVAAWTRSKLLTVLVSIGMAVIAVAIGGAKYAPLDLLFVALGTWGALKIQSGKDHPNTADNWYSNELHDNQEPFTGDVQEEQAFRLRSQKLSNLTVEEELAEYSIMLRPKSDKALLDLMHNYEVSDRELLAFEELRNYNHTRELWDELRQSSEALEKEQRRGGRKLETALYIEADRRRMDTSSCEKVRCDEAYVRSRLIEWRRRHGIDPVEPSDDAVRQLMIKAQLIKG